MYSKINEFCKVRNSGNCFYNTLAPTERVLFIIDLLKSENIPYELDIFDSRNPNSKYFNIYLIGSSDKFVVAHHDVMNPTTDNANDNSASIINAIMLKKLMPEINVGLLDGEELGGFGSQQLSDHINDGKFGTIKWVLNLELTGCGGENFFIGNYPGPLMDHIKTMFNCPVLQTPFNDSIIFRSNNIDSVVINPAPILREASPGDLLDKNLLIYNGNVLSTKMLYYCHTKNDTLSTINIQDMKDFVEKVAMPILK